MKKQRVVQAFLAVLALAGIVFFGCNAGGTYNCETDPNCVQGDGSGDSNGSNSGGDNSGGNVNQPASSPSGGGYSSPSGVTSSPSTGGGTSSSSAGSGNAGGNNNGSCLTAPLSAAPANPQTACIAINGKCYKCSPERNANECGQDWLWTGQQANDTYWFAEVPNCGSGSGGTTTSSSSRSNVASSSSRTASSSSVSTSGGGNNPYTPLVKGASGVKEGWASRYWDGCKPSCGWQDNINKGLGGTPTKTCKIDGTTVHTNKDAVNKCNDGGDSHTCYSQAPWVEGDVAYAFAASHTNNDCGRCYQVQFDGTSRDPSPSETLSHIKDKTLIIKISNIGGDVSGTQFDLMIPGGGLGAFDGFTMQGGVNGSVVSGSTRYGGFVTDCQNSNSTLSSLQTCLNNKCDQAFTNADLKSGCKVYASWFGVVNNPKFITKEITCPSQLNNKW